MVTWKGTCEQGGSCLKCYLYNPGWVNATVWNAGVIRPLWVLVSIPWNYELYNNENFPLPWCDSYDVDNDVRGLPAVSFLLQFLYNVVFFPGGSERKASACNARDLGSIPGSGSSPGEGNGNPLQYCCLENPVDGGAWWATIHRITLLSDFTSLTMLY